MSVTVTEWFPMQLIPVRDGVYKLRFYTGTSCYSMWKLGQWNMTASTAIEALKFSNRKSWQAYNGPINAWRGLASQPDTEKK